jgi:hypothetical protein
MHALAPRMTPVELERDETNHDDASATFKPHATGTAVALVGWLRPVLARALARLQRRLESPSLHHGNNPRSLHDLA